MCYIRTVFANLMPMLPRYFLFLAIKKKMNNHHLNELDFQNIYSIKPKR